MKKRLLTTLLGLALVLACAAPAMAQQEQDRSDWELAFYEIHYADRLELWQELLFRSRAKKDLEVNQIGGTKLQVYASRATQAEIKHLIKKRDKAPEAHEFQVVLLKASTRPNGAPATLTPHAQKALADLRGFLPYKSYSWMDSAPLRVISAASVRLAASYELGFQIRGNPESGFAAEFRLSQRIDDKSVVYIASDLTIRKGETVVVGTSKINSETALVVLLTALP